LIDIHFFIVGWWRWRVVRLITKYAVSYCCSLIFIVCYYLIFILCIVIYWLLVICFII